MLTILFKEALKRPLVKADRIPGHLKEESIRREEMKGLLDKLDFPFLPVLHFKLHY